MIMVKGGVGNMMKQVQQMQAKMEAIQAELEQTEVEGTSGGGMVKVVANGKQDIVSVTIDPEVVDPEDVEMLQDLILAAISQARTKAQELQSEKMAGLTGGLNIPGMNLPF
jgi:DNA-binding YbaB/EbfC family protein